MKNLWNNTWRQKPEHNSPLTTVGAQDGRLQGEPHSRKQKNFMLDYVNDKNI